MSSIESLLAKVLSYEINESVDFIILTEFAGYNPETIFRAVMASVKSVDDQKTLQFIIFFGLLRGFGGNKTWAKLIERTASDSGKALLNEAKTKFKIVMTKAKLTDVTIDRIMGAFPSLTFKAWTKIVESGHGNSKLPNYTGALPIEFRYPGSPAAMTNSQWADHKDAYIEWSSQVQALWKVSNIDKEVILKFAELQHSTALYPMKARESRP